MHSSLNNVVMIDTQVLISLLKWVIGGALLLGSFQALTVWRLLVIEQKLGNGKPGIFVRKSELDLMTKDSDNVHAGIVTSLTSNLELIKLLQSQVRALEIKRLRRMR